MNQYDKFGRKINSHSFEEMWNFGQNLLSNGYIESRNKPNLFYRKFNEGIFFADMRGTEEVPIWEDSRPLFYWNFNENLQNWKVRRLIKQELNRLHQQKCFCRLSYDWSMHISEDPLFDGVQGVYIDEESGTYGWTDGFCRFCNKDFQEEGEFCSKECENKYIDNLKNPCVACGEKIELFEEVKHHTSYFPENTVFVHKSCHNHIHKTDKYLQLRPTKEDTDNFYKK